jgi:MoaA/NifB/PqqE/SkfB family radical SAM enzyme
MTCKTAERLKASLHSPIMATALLTYSCSNDCVFCGPSEKRMETKGKSASTNEILDWLKRCKESGVSLVVFSGAADPLTHKSLSRFIEYAAQTGMHPFCYTQAHAKDRKIKEIADAGLSEIMVSVHGHNSFIHDMNTRSFGSFDLTMRGLSHIREIGLYTLTNTVVTNYNVDYLDEIVEKLAFEYGVEEMAFSFPRIEGSVKKNLDCIPPFEVASIALERVLKRLKKAGKRATVEYMPYCHLSKTYYEEMPDYQTFYKDSSHDIIVRPSEIEWHYLDECSVCKHKGKGCQGVDKSLPFTFEAGLLRETFPLDVLQSVV